jgi:hypothetical protein
MHGFLLEYGQEGKTAGLPYYNGVSLGSSIDEPLPGNPANRDRRGKSGKSGNE